MNTPFKLKYNNSSFPFKSPLKHPGHGGKKGHGHTTLFGTPVEDIGKNIKKVMDDVHSNIKDVVLGREQIELQKKLRSGAEGKDTAGKTAGGIVGKTTRAIKTLKNR